MLALCIVQEIITKSYIFPFNFHDWSDHLMFIRYNKIEK
jgi:hypothetical protein